TEKYDKAISATDQMAEVAVGQRIDETRLFKIELLTKKNDLITAKELSEEFLTRDLNEANRYHASVRLILIYMGVNLTEEAKELNEKTRKQFPEKIRLYINTGKFSRNQEIMKEQIILALSAVSDKTDFSEIYDLVYWLGRIGDFKNAALMMEKITNQNVLSEYTRELLEIYYHGGETEKLLNLSEKLLATYGPIDYLTEYKVIINQQIGNYAGAIKTCQEYLAMYPDDQLIVVRLGLLYDKAGQKDDLKELLSTIDHADNSLAFFIQKNLALLFFAIADYERFYQISYEARRQYFDEADTHREYVNLLMQRRDNTPLRDLTIIDEDFAVTVKIDEQTFETFIIESRSDARLVDGEINLANPIAIALLGKKVGDVVEIALASGTKSVEIVDVKLKYTRAFYESLQLLTGKFFQTSGVIKFQAGSTGNFFEDFKPMADLLTGSEVVHKQLDELYSQGRLTLGSMSVALNQPVIEVWRDQVIEQRRGLINQTFPPEEQKAMQEIKAGTPLIFDVISLMTISMTEAFDLVDKLPNRKIITQSVLDELTNQLKALEGSADTGKVHLKSDNGVILNGIETAEMIRDQIKHFGVLVDWVKTNCEVLPVTAAIKLNAKEKDDLDRLTGASFVDTIITAQEQKAMLVAEEKIIRAFASQKFNAFGANLYTIAAYLMQNRLIEQVRYQIAIEKLILLNYKIVPMDADTFFDIVSAHHLILEETVLKSSLGIVSPLVLGDLPVKTVVDFFYKLYVSTMEIKSSITALRINIIVKHCIDLLKMRFDEGLLQRRLLDMVAVRFKLLPFQYEELKALINTYFEHS
ncbi:MAG: PIN domain-containing protein, partial [Mucilaginibacter sp.]